VPVNSAARLALLAGANSIKDQRAANRRQNYQTLARRTALISWRVRPGETRSRCGHATSYWHHPGFYGTHTCDHGHLTSKPAKWRVAKRPGCRPGGELRPFGSVAPDLVAAVNGETRLSRHKEFIAVATLGSAWHRMVQCTIEAALASNDALDVRSLDMFGSAKPNGILVTRIHCGGIGHPLWVLAVNGQDRIGLQPARGARHQFCLKTLRISF